MRWAALAAAAAALDGAHFLGKLAAELAVEGPEKVQSAAREGIWCQVISALILLSWIAPCFGQTAKVLGGVVGLIGSISGIIYVFVGPVWHEWQQGANVGGWCIFVIVIAVLDIFRFCCVCCFAGGMVAVVLMQMQAELGHLTPEQSEYLASPEFKAKCEKLFISAGGTPGGTLKISQLRRACLSAVPPAEAACLEQDRLFVATFDSNADKELDLEAFQGVMQYVLVKAKAAGVARIPEARKGFETSSKVTIDEVE